MSYLDEFRELIGKLPASISSCTKLIDGFARADARIAELENERDALREFAVEIMGYWPHGDVGGGELQDVAIKHKLIALKNPKPNEPCGYGCACAGYPTQEEWAEGIDCYAWTPLLIRKIDAARGAG